MISALLIVASAVLAVAYVFTTHDSLGRYYSDFTERLNKVVTSLAAIVFGIAGMYWWGSIIGYFFAVGGAVMLMVRLDQLVTYMKAVERGEIKFARIERHSHD